MAVMAEPVCLRLFIEILVRASLERIRRPTQSKYWGLSLPRKTRYMHLSARAPAPKLSESVKGSRIYHVQFRFKTSPIDIAADRL